MSEHVKEHTKEQAKPCEYCGQPIINKRKNAKFCRERCRHLNKRDRLLERQGKTRTFHRWEDEEIEFLQSAASYIHPRDLARSLNVHNANNNIPARRTEQAVSIKLHLLGISTRDRVDNLDPSTLAKRLNVAHSRIQRWIESGILPAIQKRITPGYKSTSPKRRHLWSIKTDDLFNLLVERPRLGIGMDFDELRMMFTDATNPSVDELIASIKAETKTIKTHRRLCRRLHCVDTNTTYHSVNEAGTATCVSPAYLHELVHDAIANDRRTFEACGVTFAVVDLEPKLQPRLRERRERMEHQSKHYRDSA